jgi:hypothetical protein
MTQESNVRNRSIWLNLLLANGIVFVTACVVQNDPISGPKGDDGKQGDPWTCQSDAKCTCEPATTIGCYTGPVGTENVGVCRSGIKVCKADGTEFGNCLLEITPATKEDCSTPEDDNCNGQVNEDSAGCVCKPNATVDCPYSGPPGTDGVGICKKGSHACNSQGTDFISPCDGEVTPSAEFCESITDESCDGDVSCHGYHIWGSRSGDIGNQRAYDIAADIAGNALVAGVFEGEVDLGGGPLSSAGDNDIFVAKLDSAGKHIWSKRYGDANKQGGVALTVDQFGNIVVAGTFTGTIGFDQPCGNLTSQGQTDIFVAKLDPTGTCIWSKRFGSGVSEGLDDVAVDSLGNIVISTFFDGIVNFGGDSLSTKAIGGEDIAIVKLDSGGGHIWSKGFGSPSGGNQRAYRVAVDKTDNIFMVGQLDGAVDYGGGALQSAGNTDACLIKLSPTGGHVWSKRFGDNAIQIGTGIALDSAGDAFVAGRFTGVIDLGGGALPSVGGYDIFVAGFTPDGGLLWGHRFGGNGQDAIGRIAVDKADNLVATGEFSGTIDFGGESLDSIGASDLYVVKLDVLGKHIWSRSFGYLMSQQEGRSVAVDELGNVFVAGDFSIAIDLGTKLLDGQGGFDTVVMKLSP